MNSTRQFFSGLMRGGRNSPLPVICVASVKELRKGCAAGGK